MKELRGRNSSNNLKKLKKKKKCQYKLRTNFQSGLRWSTTQRLTPKADRSELPEWDQSKQLNTVVNICLGNGYRPRSLVCLLVFTTTDCFTISGLVLRISSLMNIICVCVWVCGWEVRLERNSFINALPGWAHPKPSLRSLLWWAEAIQPNLTLLLPKYTHGSRHGTVKHWQSLPHRGRMIVAQNRTNKTIGEGLAELQRNLRLGAGRAEIALLPSNIIFKQQFSEKT